MTTATRTTTEDRPKAEGGGSRTVSDDQRLSDAPPGARGHERDGGVETRETSAITSRLLLLYVERLGGPPAVEKMLELADLPYDEEQLLDEASWFSWEHKIALFEAAAEALDDPLVTRRVGSTAIHLNVAEGLKIALRALGSPRFVYQNVVRANAKFGGSHQMELVELGVDHARVRFADAEGRGRYHLLDCNYVRGLLSTVPELFGLPPARVTHRECGCRGAEACVYDVRWNPEPNDTRAALAAGAAGSGTVLCTALLAPALVPVGIAVGFGAVGLVAVRSLRRTRARRRQLENEIRYHSQAARSLTRSLQDLVSERRIEDVLAKVTRSAQLTVGGKEFALLIAEGRELTCQGSTGLPDAMVRVIERWAERSAQRLPEPLVVDDVTDEPGLKVLAELPPASFGSVCASPLVFRGDHLGVLVALAPQPLSLLPRDIELIESFAAQAAIALANARLYETLENLARRDPLTGLLNHREFHESLVREIQRCRRYGARVAVALFDLDRFKTVNDSGGHAEGDQALREVATALNGACRSSDLAFRVGGDEFALVLPESDDDAGQAAVERVREQVTSLGRPLDISAGVAAWPDDTTDKDELLALADARLYEVKRARREARQASV